MSRRGLQPWERTSPEVVPEQAQSHRNEYEINTKGSNEAHIEYSILNVRCNTHENIISLFNVFVNKCLNYITWLGNFLFLFGMVSITINRHAQKSNIVWDWNDNIVVQTRVGINKYQNFDIKFETCDFSISQKPYSSGLMSRPCFEEAQ
jgi:hypothetical protein